MCNLDIAGRSRGILEADMSIPFVIDNQQHRMADALNDLLAESVGKPLNIAVSFRGRIVILRAVQNDTQA